MRTIFGIVIAVFIMAGCESGTNAPDNLVEEETYRQMFMEFAIINQLDQNLLEKTSREELRKIVYEHYGVTEEEFRASHEFYEQDISEQLERIREMNSRLRAERDSLLTIEREYQEAVSTGKLDSLLQALPRNE